MSGIFGFSAAQGAWEPQRILDALSYWNKSYGADGYSDWHDEETGLGCFQEHLNSAVEASAPIVRYGGDLAVVDALLFNRGELLASLEISADSAISDEELLLQYIYQNGFDSLANVNGDFAGAVWQPAHNRWILFRDHSGVRPLFFTSENSRFVFSTDIRGLLGLDGFDAAVNEELLYLRMMGANYLSLCETEYQHIHCVRPASWTEFTQTESGFTKKEHIYWNWGTRKIRLGSDEAYQKELRRLVTDAIRIRLDSVPGPYGCELSGGLDSSVIAILINRLCGSGLYFSWSYGEDDVPLKEGRDERKVIRDICEQEKIFCQLDHRRAPQPFESNFANAEPPYLNTRFISHGSTYFHENGAKLVFSGHGGDEGVSHRNNLYELWHHREYLSFIRNIYSGTQGSSLRVLRTLKRAWNQIAVINRDFRKPFTSLSNSEEMLSEEFRNAMAAVVDNKSLPFAYNPIAYIQQGGHRPRLDNCALQGAQCSVRYVFPFIDHRVLDYALSIPRAQYMHDGIDRYIYRAAFRDLMPESLQKVNYKRMMSSPDKLPDVELQKEFYALRDDIESFLDKERWHRYLDFSAIRKITLPDSMELPYYIYVSRILNELSVCCAIQNAADRAGEWSEQK